MGHIEKALAKRGISDAGMGDYLDPSLSYGENLASIERLTGMRLRDWTPTEIRAAMDAVTEYNSSIGQPLDRWPAGPMSHPEPEPLPKDTKQAKLKLAFVPKPRPAPLQAPVRMTVLCPEVHARVGITRDNVRAMELSRGLSYQAWVRGSAVLTRCPSCGRLPKKVQ